jgi:uncharacterized protein (TIGR02453 family)
MREFSGFPFVGLKFLQQLPTRDKSWFQANRKTYDECIVGSSKAFVEIVGEKLRESISSSIIAVAKAIGSIAPINNDVRFSKDKSAYKDHLLFRFWEGADKKTAPTLFVRISASGVAFAQVDQWRRAIDNDTSGSALAKMIARVQQRRPVDIAGQELNKVPAPYPEDHPRGELLRHKTFQIRSAEALPKEISSPKFVALCSSRLDELADVHHWLLENFQLPEAA